MSQVEPPTVAYKQIFSKEESLLILNNVTKLQYEDAMIGYIPDKEQFSFNKKFSLSKDMGRITKRALLVDNPENNWIYERVIEAVHQANANFFKYSGMSILPFDVLEYKVGGKFDWHMDSGIAYPYTERLLSIILFLSESSDYEGGQLEFMPTLKHNLTFEQGHIMIFPSHIVHRVSPVTKGIRRSIVSWGYKDGTVFSSQNPTLNQGK